MKGDVTSTTGQSFRLAIFIGVSILVLASSLYGQSGSGTRAVPCMVNYLRLRITTGQDDLRGWDGFSTSKDNLDVTVYFGENGSQLAADVNNNQEWKNNSVHLVEIKLNQAVPLKQIKGIELKHTGSDVSFDAAKASTPLGPLAGLQSPDTWDMQRLEVTAVGGGVGATILRYGPKSFTNGDRVLSTRAQIPANSCNVDEQFWRLNPGKKDVQPLNGAGSRYGKEQPAPSALQLPSKNGNQQLQNNEIVRQALAHVVQIGPRASVQGGDRDYSAIIAIIKRQSAASRSLVTSSVRPPNESRMSIGGSGGTSQSGTLINPGTNNSLSSQPLPPKGSSETLLNPGTTASLSPQPLPPKGSTPMLGAGQTMSASGTQSSGASASRTATKVSSPGQQQPLTQICRAGIATIDGAPNGVWFSPVAGEDGKFVIQGCSFGNAPGEVYLSGVQFDPAHARSMVQRLGATNSPDRVYFNTLANNWSDRQIVAQIDPNAGGFYDTNNVTLNVKTASGQVYQATGMNFLAAREDLPLNRLLKTPANSGQDTCYGLSLSECLMPGINLAVVTSSLGPLQPEVESPTQYWLTPGDSIAVVRGVIYLNPTDSYSVNFPSSTDTYQFNFAPGFQLVPITGVQLSHASMDASHCQSLGGVYANSGNWSVSYMSTSSFQVHWEEESCSPGSEAAKQKPGTIGTTSGFAGFSAYELKIIVRGPRGVNPFASGNINGMAIKQLQPVQMLQKN